MALLFLFGLSPPSDSSISASATMSEGVCRDWNAWLDRQPLGPPTLHVIANCEFPTAGYSTELRRHEPQGFNPRYLLLDRVTQAPQVPMTPVVSTVRIHYREKPSISYDAVTILPDGPTIPVGEVF